MSIDDIINEVYNLKQRAIRDGKSDDYVLGMYAVQDLLVGIRNECDQLDKRQDIASLEDAIYKYGYDKIDVMDLLKFIVEHKHQ